MRRTNTAEHWNRLWQNAPAKLLELQHGVNKAEKSVIWSTVQQWLGGPEMIGLRTIEIGAGSGTVSALFARHGARVTVLDYSREALEASAALFRSLSLTHDVVEANALDVPAWSVGKYDVAMSFGLAEHFEGADRRRIIKAHLDLLKPGGFALITVPNKNCWPYRFWKARREMTGKWPFGLEIPFSRSELTSVCRELGVSHFDIAGSPFLASLDFILPFNRWKRSIEKRVLKERRFDPARIAQEKTGPLGRLLGYALILAARKPSD